MPVTFKFVLPQEGVTRKVTFPSKPKWHELATKVESLFSTYHLPANEIALSYIDADNDSITISTGEELRDFYIQEEEALLGGAPFKFFVKRLPRPGATTNRLSDTIPQVDEDPLGPNSPDSGMLGGHGWDDVENDSLPDEPPAVPLFTAAPGGGIGIQPLMHSMFSYIPAEGRLGRASPAISEARIEEVPSRSQSRGIVEEPPSRQSRARSPSPVRVPPTTKPRKGKLADRLAEKMAASAAAKDREKGKAKDTPIVLDLPRDGNRPFSLNTRTTRDDPIVVDLPRDNNRPFSLNTRESTPLIEKPIPQVPFSRRETGPTVVDTPTSDEEFDLSPPPSPPKPTRSHRPSKASRPTKQSSSTPAPPSIYSDISEVMEKLSLVMKRASDGTYIRNQYGVIDPTSAEAAMEDAKAAIEDTAKAVGSSLNSVLSQLSAHIPQKQAQPQPRSKKSDMPFFGSSGTREPRPREPSYSQPQPRPSSFYGYETPARDAGRPPFAPPPQMAPPQQMAPPPVQMHSRPDDRVPPPFVPYGAYQQQPPVMVPAPGLPPLGSFFGTPAPTNPRPAATQPQYQQPMYGQYPMPQEPLPQTRPTRTTYDPPAPEVQSRPVQDFTTPLRASGHLPSAAEREKLDAAKQLYKMEKATFRAQREAERREREERRALRQKGNPEYANLAHSLEAVFAAHQAQERESRPESEEEEEEQVEPPRPIRPSDVPSFFEPPTFGQPDPPGASEDEGPIHVFPAETPSGPSKHRGPYHERYERLIDALANMGFPESTHPSVPQIVKEESRQNLSWEDDKVIQRIIDRVLESEEPQTPAPQPAGPSKAAANKNAAKGRKGRK